MFSFNEILSLPLPQEISDWIGKLPSSDKQIRKNGHYKSWKNLLEQLPAIQPSVIDLNDRVIKIGKKEDSDSRVITDLKEELLKLKPWRKGPYRLFDIFIDTEWRSDFKWERIENHLSPLEGKTVLDVGCGNGYHGWRMLGKGAELVVGVDPFLLSVVQFEVVKRFAGEHPFFLLPIGIEAIPKNIQAFDMVFSMGLLYHRRSPIDHLFELKSFLKPGGELVLETLVVDGAEGYSLFPRDRYAKMRNVWFIPSTLTLEKWLERVGFKNIRLIDVSQTNNREQRVTEWMDFESLDNFLMPDNKNLTIEGYPAPKRALYIIS